MAKIDVQKKAAEMTPALRKELEKVKGALVKAETGDVLARHAVGVLVNKVEGTPGKYGHGAVKKLEAAIGLDENTLYQYARVAETWSAVEVKKILKRMNRHGLPLTWSHLDVLAGITSKSHRDKWLTAAVDHGWSVRQLRRQIGTARPGVPAPVDSDDVKAFVVLAEAASHAELLLEETKRFAEPDFLAALVDGEATKGPHLRASLERARDVHAKARDACSHAVAVLEAQLDRLAEADSPPSVPAAPVVGQVAGTRRRRSDAATSSDERH